MPGRNPRHPTRSAAIALGTNRQVESAVPSVRRDAEQSDRDGRAPLSDCIVPAKRMSAYARAGSKTGDPATHAASRRSFLSSLRVGPAVEAVTPRLARFTSSAPAGEAVRNFATIDGKCFKR